MGTTTALDAEACSHDYAAQLSVKLIRKSDNKELGEISCYTNIVIGNVNERPTILSSSLVTKSVTEDKLPGFAIGSKLQASDAEVAVGLQQLTWSIVSCEPFSFDRSGGGSYQPDMVAASSLNCDIKVSSCDGQLSVASILNYETYTKYRLIIQVTDDGSPPYSSAQSASTRTIIMNIVPKNDIPTISTRQTFYIKENVATGTYVNLMGDSGVVCSTNPSSSSCEIMASDVDSNKVGFQFIQIPSNLPFEITKKATRDAVGTNILGESAYNIFTTLKFSSASVMLNYESENSVFDLSVYVKDSANAISLNQCMVTIVLVDDNDKPYLDLPEQCSGKLCVQIEENNNEGVGSDRQVNLLTYTQDEDTQSKWKCCAPSNPFALVSAVSVSSKACVLSKFASTANGFKGLAEQLDFEASKGCDLIVRITDKGAEVSEDQLVHVKIIDVNDPPQNVALIGAKCEVEENTPVNHQLPVDASSFCQLTATDQDDTILSFLQSSPPSLTGVKGNFFPTVAGNTDSERWTNLNYFRVESNGKFAVNIVPDHEIAKVLTFDVYSRDDRGRMSSKKTISITIIDVNEAPIIDATTMIPQSMPPAQSSGRVGGDNQVCTARFALYEFKKYSSNGMFIPGQSVSPLFDSADNTNPPLNFLAADPDQDAVNASWKAVTYSLTSGYYDSDVFEIDAASGAISPKSLAMESVDFELLSSRAGVGDGLMRINLVASDGGGLATDCDVYVNVFDVNEPPAIRHIYLGSDGAEVGESTEYPFIIDSQNVMVGESVGPKLPAEDPDVAMQDTASCRLATLEDSGLHSADDRELFGITEDCQIYVKQITTSSKNLQSGTDTEYYTLYVEAFDQGDSSGVVLYSDSRMYHIHGKTGLSAPVFDVDGLVFQQKENVAGIVAGQASTSTKDYTHWSVGTPQKLFVACTDDNVYQRGSSITPALAGERTPACSTHDGQKNECIGYIGNETDPITGCNYDESLSKCNTRQQSLKFQILPASTFPQIPTGNVLDIDPTTSLMSFQSASTPNYEALLIPNDNIQCDLGPPVRSGDGSASNLYQWVGRFPNGVKGICRMFDNKIKQKVGKKPSLGYLDAAALCAKGAARLPTLGELQTAAEAASAVTADDGTSGETVPVSGEPSSSVRGGTQGTGAFPMRPMNILDLWNWEQLIEPAGTVDGSYSTCRRTIPATRTATNLCEDGSASNPCPCPTTTGIDNSVNVWTYNGRQAKFTSGGTAANDTVWGDPAVKSIVSEITSGFSSQENLPVLCYVGDGYVNHKWFGNTNTPDSYSQKVREPVRGYSTLVRCLDTAEFTVADDRFEYWPQSQKADKYVFVEVHNEPEDPSFAEPTLDVYIDENKNIGSLAIELRGVDEDPGDAMELTFELTATNPSTLAFELGTPETVPPYQESRAIPLNLKVPLDFESQPVHTMTIMVKDSTLRFASQSITIHLNDENEAPVLRSLDNPSEDSAASPAVYKRFQMNENSPANFEIGELKAWDPDANNMCVFTVSGADNQQIGVTGDIFSVRRTERSSSGAGLTGKMTVSVLELRNGGVIDYETKQLYTLNVTVSDGSLQDTAKVEIEIVNVNDVTVEEVTVFATGEKILQTIGNEVVHISGTNFGIKWGVDTTMKPEIKVKYGRLDKDKGTQWFEATGCVVDNPGVANTLIVCNSHAGFGTDQVWNVEILRQSTGNQEGVAESTVTTSYATPSITSIVLAHSGLAANSLDTRGANALKLTGSNFGLLNLQLEGYYSADTSKGWYTAVDCIVTVANIEATCSTRAGIGSNMVWKLEKVDHEWLGSASPASVTTSYQVPSITEVANCALSLVCPVSHPFVAFQGKICYTLKQYAQAESGPCESWCTNNRTFGLGCGDPAEKMCTTACSAADNRKEFTTHGNQDVYLTGDNFGPLANPSNSNVPADPGAITTSYSNSLGYSYYQQLRCEVVTAHTQIRCKTVAGVSKDFVWVVKVAGQSSPKSSSGVGDMTFYTRPVITSVTGPGAYKANTRGGQKLYIEGDFFGPVLNCRGGSIQTLNSCIDNVIFATTDTDDPVLKHEFKGVDCIVQNAQTMIVCTSPEGVGKNFAYKISVGGQSSPMNAALTDPGTSDRPSYQRPVLAVLGRSNGALLISTQDMIDADTRGYLYDGDKTDIYDGGKIPETILITGSNFGPVNSGRCKQNGRPCMVDGDCFNAVAASNTCVGASSAVSWNVISAIFRAKSLEVGATAVDTYNATNCVVVEDHVKIKCDFAQGAGKTQEWIVTVGQQGSLTPSSSYHSPVITSITGAGAMNGKTNGVQEIILNGLNFGPYLNGANVSYGVQGEEYTPTNCVVVSHTQINCVTVPGIGINLLWRVTIRHQSNELIKTSSYAAPTIHSITPSTASADGSNTRDFLLFLNTSDSGLADPLSTIVVQFEKDCATTVNTCGPYEIPIEPKSEFGTRREDNFDILAFRVPMLLNQRNAKDIPVSLVVFPKDRKTGNTIRSAAVKSQNSVLFSYDFPFIEQIIVTEHPWINGMRKLTVIGRNFGEHEMGVHPLLEYAMTVNNIPLDGRVSEPITMQLGVDIRNENRTGTYVQSWMRGAQNERHDEIIIIWAANAKMLGDPRSNYTVQGKISISRGGVTSNVKKFEDLTPSIVGVKYEKIIQNANALKLNAVPTEGSKAVNPQATHDITMEIQCRNCGTSKQMCCMSHNFSACEVECLTANTGIPKLAQIFIGSSQLDDADLQECPIIDGSSKYNAGLKQWTYQCQVPPYQGSGVDTRIRYDGRWSNSTLTRYLAPTIDSLGSSVGGTKGSSRGSFTGEMTVAAITDSDRLLLVRTNGEKIKITGKNFGKPFAGDITKFNQNYVVYGALTGRLIEHYCSKTPSTCQRWRPAIEQTPHHGGLSVMIPSGTSAARRSINVVVGQYNFELQSTEGNSWSNILERTIVGQIPPDTTTMYIAYRKPTLVAELVPLWRYNQDNQAGGFEVTIYGYDFMTAQQGTTTHSLTDTQVWFRAELNETSGNIEGTPCVLQSTSYSEIVCVVGRLVPTNTRSIDDDVAIAVTVDGQTTMSYISQSVVTAAKDANSSNTYTEDEALIVRLSGMRDQAFQTQLDVCMSLSDGLIPSIHAYFIDSSSSAQEVTTEQDIAFSTDADLLTARQTSIQECVSVVVTAFNKACSNTQTIESAAVLEAAYLKDEAKGRTATRTENICALTLSPPGPSEGPAGPGGGPSSSTTGNGNSVSAPGDVTAPPMPAVVSIRCGAASTADIRQLPTRGGEYLFVKTQGLTINYNYRAWLIDETGEYSPISVKGGMSGSAVIQPVDYQSGRVFGNLTLKVPPGQGKQRRLILESDAKFGGFQLRSDGGQTLEDTIGYAVPWVNATTTPMPIQTSTDSCLPNQYESQLSWAARVENLRSGVVDGVRIESNKALELDERMYERRCLKYDTIELWGTNFGEETSQLKVWVEAIKMSSNGELQSKDTIQFWIYNGSAYSEQMKVHSDILNRGFSGTSSAFSLVHTHNHLVLRGPRGYGSKCTLHLQVADQTTTIPIDFSFKPPTADYSEPRAYDPRGEFIVIHGQNFGGVASEATVFINDEPCDDALWNRQHEIVGLPFVSCRARETVAGIANVSLFVAGQQSSFIISGEVDAAGVRTVCQESKKEKDVDLKTGRPLEYWGRNEPVGELCTPCQDGSLCDTRTYTAPTSLSGYYMVELDISKSLTGEGDDSNGDDTKDLLIRRERRDYERALESFRHNNKRVCPSERLFDLVADAKLVKQFPFAAATKRELCLSAMPCKPASACKGRDECADGYQYQQLRCNTSTVRMSSSGDSIIQACNSTMQCQSRSAGTACTDAISNVCGCPTEWELGVRKCLKECVRDPQLMLELSSAGCTTALLENSLAGKSCAYNHPEDCATCQVEKVCVDTSGAETNVPCSNRGDCIESVGFGGTCKDRGRCTCSSGTARCILCTAGTHYRLDGKCEKCPENMELVFAGFFIGIFFAIIGAYILDQKKFNLAFLIIPVDYFQVLALLSRADIRWPNLLLEILRALQFFNFNLDIATPECLLAGVFTYEMKYYATLLIAPCIIVFLILAFCWHQCYSYCFMMHRKPDKLYASKLVGTFMLLIYCVYLSCTTRALEVFNCSPTTPDDGWEYVGFTDLSCDGGGLCRCWDPEHLPYKLLLPSLLAIGVYTLGFPLFLFWLLRCGNRKALIKEDQILRAMGLGDTQVTNPRSYHIRVRFHKMYYYYKPGKSYWMLVILARKVGIACCSLVFRTNPGFMLASIVGIMFIAFSLQTRHNPYMSTSQRQLVLAEHSIKAESGDKIHLRIQNNIQHVKDEQEKKSSAKKQVQRQSILGGRGGVGTSAAMKNKNMDKKNPVEYFFDYNTVELSLLFCAVLVCLAGIMFESDRFKETNGSGTMRYAWQRDMVTYVVITIVLCSFVYLAIVITNEITGYTPACLRRACRNKQSALMSAASTIQDHKDDHIEMSIVNPVMISSYVLLFIFYF